MSVVALVAKLSYLEITIDACNLLKSARSTNKFNANLYDGALLSPISPLNLVYNSAPANDWIKLASCATLAIKLRISLKSTTLSLPLCPGLLFPKSDTSNSTLKLRVIDVISLYAANGTPSLSFTRSIENGLLNVPWILPSFNSISNTPKLIYAPCPSFTSSIV